MTTSNSKSFRTSAPAKLNITLQITGIEASTGYHEIRSVMQTVEHSYPIRLRPVNEGEENIMGCEKVHSILRKATDKLSEFTKRKLPCEIIVPETLLLGAGMGIDSSLAAATLRLANAAFDLKLATYHLHVVAAEVGNDVQFAVYGGRATVWGGKVHSIRPETIPPLYYVIAKPEGVSLQTPLQYGLHDETGKSLAELACEASAITRQLFNTTIGCEAEHGVTGKGPTVFWGYTRLDQSAELQRRIQKIEGISVFAAQPIVLPAISTDPLSFP